MTIFDLLKALKRGYWYNVPLDPFAQNVKHRFVNHHEAGSHLVELRNKLQDKYKVKFELEEPQKIPVYIVEKKCFENTNAVKVNVIIKEK